MSVARDRSEVLARAHSPERSNRMEFVGSQGSSAGAAGLLVVPGPNYLDFDVDLDDDDDEVVIGIRPKSSPQPRRKTSVSDDESDISEPPSSSGSRRVSFADAVGLNLVQVKEFDKWDLPQLPNILDAANTNDDEYLISPVNFPLSLPSEKIFTKVLDQKVELESVKLLPGTTILKGVIHVLNISFTKAVYVRTSLDNWVSHFDLLSEYVPGSSGGHLDRFAFKLTLVPPFAEQGARVDFCLRYETPNGTFWDNNSNKNYVLFCHKRKEVQDKPQKESVNKKSCLKSVSRSFFVEESMSSLEQENLAADLATQQKSINETQYNQSDNGPVKSEEDANTLQVENRRNRSRRNRRKAARMAQVRDRFSQKDLTTQDCDTQASSEKHIPTAQQQNQITKYSNPKGSVQLEDSANGSQSKDSNSKTHENFNLPDAATFANDRRDESKDVPNVATELLQNTNNFASTSEAASPEAASYCGRPSVERDDSERLVSDSSGFAFGTVVAPLYQEVSGRGVGSQSCSEIYNSKLTKEQQEREAWRSSADSEGIGCCCSDGIVASCEQSGATSSINETIKVDNAFEKGIKIQELTEVQTNTISDPVNPIDSLDCDVVNASEQILDHEKTIQNSDLSLERQETFPNESFQTQLLENDDSNCLKMKRDETVLKTKDYQFEKRPCQSSNITDRDGPGLENSTTNVALPQSNVLFEEENTSLSFELSQNELARSCDITIGAGLEIVDKALDISSKDFKYEENVSSPFQPAQNEDLVGQSASGNDMMVFPSLDIEACNLIVSSYVSKTVTENARLSQNVCLSDSPTKTMDESSLEFDDQTRAVSPKHVSETSADADKSLLFEQTLAESLSNQPTITSALISEQSPDSSTSILTVSPMSEEENAQLGSELLQNVDWSLIDHNESIVVEDQIMALTPTCTFETPEKENHLLLAEQNKSLVDKPNETSDLTGEESLDDEGPQRKATNLSTDENIVDVATATAQNEACGILDGGNVTLLREQNEDSKNKPSTEHNNSTKITPRQELDDNVEENACCLQDRSNNRGNLSDNKYDCEAGSVAVTSSLVSELLEENPKVSQNDKLSHPDELNIEHDEKMLAISSNLEISGGENVSLSMQLPQNEGLPDQPDDSGDSAINLEPDHKLSETVNLLPCQESTVEPLPVQISKCSSVDLVGQPSHANSLLAQLGLAQDFTKTLAVLEKEDTKCTNVELAGHEVVALSGICFELEVTKSCEEIEQKETSKRNEELTESINIGSAEDAVESKTNIYCDEPARISRSRYVGKFELLSQIETMDIALEDCVKTWEAMVDEEQENVRIQATNQDIVDVATHSAENNKLESLYSKMDDVELSKMEGSQRIAFEYAREDIEKKESKPEDFYSVARVNDETYFAPVFEDGIPSSCTSYEENVKDCASVSSNASENEKQLNECTGSKIMVSMHNMSGCKNTDVDEMEKVKTQLKTNEEERFKIPPRRVKSKLFAPVDNVQEGIQSSPDKIVEETTHMPIEIDKTDFFRRSKDTNIDTFAGDLKCDQNSDDDGRSESESGSDDEMELYMHCLRAVYGQQSSPKGTKPAQNRDEGFKRLPATRSKRMSTSLPSISESFDEERATDIMNGQERETETVEGIAQALPDSSVKDDDYLRWRQSFSCRNILKSLLYATLGVIFLAVAYHYDFIACFGLYMMSLIWLFFQGDGPTGKNKS